MSRGALPGTMRTPREQQYITILLPVGIVAAILVDAVVLAAAGPGGWSPQPGEPSLGPPVPAGITFGPANITEPQGSATLSVLLVPSGWVLGNTTFSYTNSSGEPMTSGISAVLERSGVPLALYNFTLGQWASGGTVIVSEGDTLVLTSAIANALIGGTLTIYQANWTTSIGIPGSTIYPVP